MVRLILASGSPRRAEMMARIIKDFKIIAPDVDETSHDNEKPEELVERLAVKKAQTVFNETGGKYPVLAADTIVVHDRILSKPIDAEEAEEMLTKLAGDEHIVITGVAFIDSKNSNLISFIEKTKVYFGPITNAEIKEYISGGEPMDKAGAYGIQGAGSRFIEKVDGCFYNVMGFPINKIYTILKEAGIV